MAEKRPTTKLCETEEFTIEAYGDMGKSGWLDATVTLRRPIVSDDAKRKAYIKRSFYLGHNGERFSDGSDMPLLRKFPTLLKSIEDVIIAEVRRRQAGT